MIPEIMSNRRFQDFEDEDLDPDKYIIINKF